MEEDDTEDIDDTPEPSHTREAASKTIEVANTLYWDDEDIPEPDFSHPPKEDSLLPTPKKRGRPKKALPPREQEGDPPEDDDENPDNLPGMFDNTQFKTKAHPIDWTEEDLESCAVSAAGKKMIKSELGNINVYLSNIAVCFGQATSVSEVCALVNTGMKVLQGRRELFTKVEGNKDVGNEPSDGTFEPIP
jgi:hypothetical protein